MTPEEIKKKAAALKRLFAAVAEGKTLQHRWEYGESKGWNDTDGFPCMDSDLSFWRVKPQAIWIIPSEITGRSAREEMRRVYYSESEAPPEAVKYEEVIP